MNQKEREKKIVQTSFIGIGANILLAAFKAVVGVLSHSIAIVLDAVNNLSDALSSVITILGAKLAGKAPDKKHPLGYGRIEYLSASIISVIVLYAGITSLVESVKKILAPETPDYTPVSLLIVAAAVVVKILLGHYVKKTGEEINSEALVDSGQDALQDAILSASTLVAAVLYLVFHLQLEAFLGVLISIMIIKSGIEMLQSTLSQILGERVEGDLAQNIKSIATSVEGVEGAYDLIIHNYGPDKLIGSLHVEVPDTMTATQIDKIARTIEERVYKEQRVAITAVGIYPRNTGDDKAAKMREKVTKLVTSHEYVLQMHGYYVDEATKQLRFDVIIDFAAPDRLGKYKEIVAEVQKQFPDYNVQVTLDTDISD
ncbi:MAG: cation transporter [Lachnospiraceae bacterium]|nr:cation transporter [Lachnospiraceae bacterium]